MTNFLPPEILPQVEIIDGVAVTTSRDIAKHFDKEHKNVLQSIREVACSEEFARLNFQLCYENNELQNGKPLPFYRVTKDGFFFLVMGFTGEKAALIKEAYINAFNQMEKYLREQAQLSSGNGTTHWMNRCMELQEELLQLYRKQVVQKRPRRRLTIDAIWEIRLLHEQGFPLADIVGMTGHDESTVTYVINLKYPNLS